MSRTKHYNSNAYWLRCIHDAFARYASPNVMHQPLILHGEEETVGLIDCFKEAFNDQATSDLVIQIQEEFIYVHKTVLMIRCQYFRTIFSKTLNTNNQKKFIKHHKFSYNVYKAFLRYLYTDELDLHPENMQELLKLANTYSENQLKNNVYKK